MSAAGARSKQGSAKSKTSSRGKSAGKGASAPAAAAAATGSKDNLQSLQDMQAQIDAMKKQVESERAERNYFQLERDKLNTFWEITRNELNDLKADLHNKDRELEELEEKHQVEIKVYKQKVKHLLYEYQNNVTHLQGESEHALQLDQEEHMAKEQELKRDKRALKLELKEFELSHEDIVKGLKLRHDQEITRLRADFERRARELYAKYERKMKVIREDLELRRKNEIHEIEERKNGQINALMKNHEKAFADIKNYYNDITLNNLALINSLKEQVEEMKKKEERNEKLMAEITAENKRLSEPLHKALEEGDNLRRQLANYDKDKQSLANAKARLRVLDEQLQRHAWEHEVLRQRFELVQKERDALYSKFVSTIHDVQQKTGFKNMLLERKLETMSDELEKKDVQLSEVLRASNLDPTALSTVTRKLEDILDSKNKIIQDLQFELARMTKSYNDMVLVSEAKLTEGGVLTEDFTFKPRVPRLVHPIARSQQPVTVTAPKENENVAPLIVK